MLRLLRSDNFPKNGAEITRDFPVRIVRLEFAQIRDITDVIALASFLDIFPVQCFSGHLGNFRDGFEHRDAIRASPAKVIDLAGSWVRGKFLDGANDVVAVNVVANLFGLVAKDRLPAAGERNFYQIGKKTVQLNAGMRRSGQASAPEDAGVHAEVAAILLRNQIGSGLRSSEK